MSDPVQPTIYPYRISMRLTHKKSKQFEDHDVPVKSYSLSDAMLQCFYQVQADLDVDLADYDVKVLRVGPDLEARVKVPGMVPVP